MQLFTYNDYLDYVSNSKIKKLIQGQNKKAYNIDIIEKNKRISKEKKLVEMFNENIENAIEKLLYDEQEVSYIINDYFKIQICDVNSENLELLENSKIFKSLEKSKIIDSQVFKVKNKDIYFIIKFEKNPNYNIPYIIFNECMELIKNLKEVSKEKMPIVIPIVIYVGNEKWNTKHNTCIRYTSFGENNVELGYNILDFNMYDLKYIISKKSRINKYIVLKKEMEIYLIENNYNL